jgi:hypothetical protein
MPKVTGTAVIGLTTRAADFTIIQYSHPWIKETANLGFIAFIRGLGRDLHHGTPLNFIRGQNTKLNPNDGFNIRRMLVETGRHSVLEVETVNSLLTRFQDQFS